MTFTIAIIGRPNVGKSTLFNRLAGKKLALVDDTPGVTRDRREAEGSLGDLRFHMIDTAGLEEAADSSLEGRMRAQTQAAMEMADCVLLVIDGRAGVTPMDEHFARLARKGKAPLILVVNKCEGRAGQGGISDAYALGLGDPVPLSAEHGEGMSDLYDRLAPFDLGEETAPPRRGEEAAQEEAREDGEEDEEESRLIKIAIVGRPNVGKSTLINRLIGAERLLTGPEAGITRDAIALPWTHGGRAVELVDTAGLRRRSKVVDKLEKMSVHDTERAIRLAQVVVLVLDAETPLEKQDLSIARVTIEEGRALVIAVNKWDLVTSAKETMGRIHDRLETSLPQVKGVSVVTFSAKTGRRTDSLMPEIFKVYDIWNRRIPTSALNQWLAEITAYHPPPLAAGRRLKLRYMTQVKARPPTFALFANRPGELPSSYVRYLENSLRETFDLPGVPLRIFLRKGENPYAR